ncbi:hypothetical protein X975_06849, partial [Stegodyphus mimosarum]
MLVSRCPKGDSVAKGKLIRSGGVEVADAEKEGKKGLKHMRSPPIATVGARYLRHPRGKCLSTCQLKGGETFTCHPELGPGKILGTRHST